LGLVSLDELAEIPLIRECIRRVHDRFGRLHGKLLRKAIVHELIDRQVTDVLDSAEQTLISRRFESAQEARRGGLTIRVGPSLDEQKRELEEFLYQRVYRHRELLQMRERAQNQLRSMFRGYCQRPALLPTKYRARTESAGIARAVGDYLAGMTDRYCEQQYAAHFS
jgi:dGTPase